VEALNVRVLHPLSGRDDVQLDAAGVGPLVQCPPNELRAVVQHQVLGQVPTFGQPVQDLHDPHPRSEVSTSLTKPLRLNASITLNVRNRCPVTSLSSMKSMVHR
jgi:hypothetical protein